MMWKFALLIFIAPLAGCSSPSGGPAAGGFYSATDPRTNERIPVVRLADAPMVPLSTARGGNSTTDTGLAMMKSSGFSDVRMRQGDVIEITILDTGEDGLFSSTDSKTLNLGRFTVDSSGNVTLPFVGKQHVVNSSPEALQGTIVAGLKGSAVNPQAVVTVVDRPSSGFIVNGDVRSAGRFPLSARKEKVLDAIALAGGTTATPGAATVTLIRGSKRATAPIERVMNDSSQNVYLLPDDQLYVGKDAPTFTAFGAFKSVGEFEFEPDQLTLMQAFSRAGGLLDDQADARNFYVVRNQTIDSADDCTNTTNNSSAPYVSNKPAIYRVDMTDVSNLALMQQFKVMDGDILYAANSSMVNFAKLFTIFQKSAPTATAPLPGIH